jgi:hypothetical protein
MSGRRALGVFLVWCCRQPTGSQETLDSNVGLFRNASGRSAVSSKDWEEGHQHLCNEWVAPWVCALVWCCSCSHPPGSKKPDTMDYLGSVSGRSAVSSKMQQGGRTPL